MSNTKKYYWLKLKNDFFSQREVKKLRKVAGGDTFTIIYLKMQLLSIKNEGIIIFEDTEENLSEQLALELDEELENVELTLAFLLKNNLINYIDNKNLLLNKVPECIGAESKVAERVRKHRENKKEEKVLHCNALVTNCNTEIEKEIEIEIEIDKELDKDLDLKKENKNKCIDHQDDLKAFFEIIWSLYPNKKGKAGVSITQIKKLHKLGVDEISKCVDRYKRTKESWKEYQQGSTFFNKGYIDYLDENFKEVVQEKPYNPYRRV